MFVTISSSLQAPAEVNEVVPQRRKSSSKYDAPVGSEEDSQGKTSSDEDAGSSDAESEDRVFQVSSTVQHATTS